MDFTLNDNFENDNGSVMINSVSKIMRYKGATSKEVELYQDKSTEGDYDNMVQVSLDTLEKYKHKKTMIAFSVSDKPLSHETNHHKK